MRGTIILTMDVENDDGKKILQSWGDSFDSESGAYKSLRKVSGAAGAGVETGGYIGKLKDKYKTKAELERDRSKNT